ncbi:hypothetical protein DSTSK_28310 [Desulforhabdus sp. TSK]|nr:hypothetical protein DSTSK_28310 [Desulforhabdus sp. TSK]
MREVRVGLSHEILQVEYMEHVALIRTGLFSRGFDTMFPCFVLFDKVEGKMSYDGQIGGSLSHLYSVLIFSKGYVETPVQPVFYAPMSAGCLSKSLGITDRLKM